MFKKDNAQKPKDESTHEITETNNAKEKEEVLTKSSKLNIKAPESQEPSSYDEPEDFFIDRGRPGDIRGDGRDEFYGSEDELALPPVLVERFKNNGYVLRWVRVLLEGEEDFRNIAKRQKEGWVFVEQKHVPEISVNTQIVRVGRWENLVTQGDLALAAARIEDIERVRRSIDAKTARQLQAEEAKYQDNNFIKTKEHGAQVFYGRKKPEFHNQGSGG